MNVLIVLAHPEPRSMNGAMVRTAEQVLLDQGHSVRVRDLHAMDFAPVMAARDFAGFEPGAFLKYQAEQERASQDGRLAADIQAEIAHCHWADLLILQFPISWFSVPAILKGWIDRVFVRGIFYATGKMFETGGMRGKRAMLSLTTGGLPASFAEGGPFGNLDGLLYPLHYGTLRFVGYDVLAPSVVYGPARIGQQERERYLRAWAARLMNIEQEHPMALTATSAKGAA